MISIKNKSASALGLLLLAVSFTTCTKKWDDHNTVTDAAIANNLYQGISKTANLGKFSGMLVKTGYDSIISSSKTYTVWAPTDAALANLDISVTNDPVKLKLFVANHISNQSYLSGGADQRIQMLNGKYIIMSGSKFDSANIVTPNQYASNGVFHVIDKFIPRIDNCWEFVNNTSQSLLNKAFLLSLNYNFFDSSKATQTGVDPLTGNPVYKPGTGLVPRNQFLDKALNINDESNQYTVILLTDAAYTTELNKLTPWFNTTSIDSTNTLGGFHLVKDLVFKGTYTAAQLADTMVSQFGVKVPVNKTAIVASYKTSNGIIHIMNKVDFNLTYKFPPIIIQGENPTFFVSDLPANTFYRIRVNPNTGATFNDILMQNYNVANYYIHYLVKNINSMRYNAFWVSVNDVQTTPLWQQRLGIDSTNNTANLPYVTVAYKNYNEVPLGQLNITKYRDLKLFVIGPPPQHHHQEAIIPYHWTI